MLAGRWRKGRLTFFCDAEGVRVSLPQDWTDRGPEPSAEPVSAESLTALRALLDRLDPPAFDESAAESSACRSTTSTDEGGS
ncbi:hypothetical protein E1264_38025 [Actinomadura sp. KC216]|nr:hypothetical protein E1264_38025 [Actinomadura sp. KC216]